MNNSDKKNIVIFIILVISIIILVIYNLIKDNKKDYVDRKVDKIFNKYSYSEILAGGEDLFLNGIKLLLNNNEFIYEKNTNTNKVNLYSINNYNKYKKISNANIFVNLFKESELEKFMELKHIIAFENNYFIESYNDDYVGNYIGSEIDLDTYNENIVIFKVNHYYCDNTEFIGLLKETPKCDYKKKQGTITITNENNFLRLNDLDELKNILK